MNMKKFDTVVVGSGFAGAVTADKLAREQDKKVLILEKRSHIGGNCYDIKDEHGILIHQYGPHIFHTNNKDVFEYLSKYTDWYNYSHEVVANIDGQYIPVPFNLNTLKMVYGEEGGTILEGKLIGKYGYGRKVPILELRNDDDDEIRGDRKSVV